MKSEHEKASDGSAATAVNTNDITFDCPQCGKSMVADRAAEGMILECIGCHGKITVPSKAQGGHAGEPPWQELMKENLQLRAHLELLEKQQQEFLAKFNTVSQRVGPRAPLVSATPGGDVSELRAEIAAIRSVLAGISAEGHSALGATVEPGGVAYNSQGATELRTLKLELARMMADSDRQRDDYLSLIRTGLEEARESRRLTDEMLRLVVDMAGRNGRSVRAEDPERDSQSRVERRKQDASPSEIERLKGELRDARADLFRLTTASGWESSTAPSSAPSPTAEKASSTEVPAPIASTGSSGAQYVALSETGNGTTTAESEPSLSPPKTRKGRRRRARAYVGMLLPFLIFAGVFGIIWRVFVSKTQASAPAPSINTAVQTAPNSEPLASKSIAEEKTAESPEQLELKSALELVRDGKLAEAIPVVRGILERNPSSTEARHWLAAMLAEQGQHQEAIREYRQVLVENPKHVGTLNNLAYLLATNPEESLRNGKEAVTLATRAWELSSQRNPSILDTLAAAYAESGQFPQAVSAAKSAVAMALSNRNNEVADQIKSRLQWYEMGFPYRDNTQRAIRRAVDREAQG